MSTIDIIINNFSLGKDVTIKPQGSSMYPFLLEGRNMVIVSPLTKRMPKRGDIILYKRDNGMLVLHRLYRVKKDKYYFVGDHQTEIEGPLKKECLLGIVSTIVEGQKSYSVNRLSYVILSRLWLFFRPIRPCILKSVKIILTFFHIIKTNQEET